MQRQLIFRYSSNDKFLLFGHAKLFPSPDSAVVHLVKKNQGETQKKRGMIECGNGGGCGLSYNRSLQSGVLLNPAEQCSLSSILILHMNPSRAPSPQTVICASLPRRFHLNVSQHFNWFPESQHLSASYCYINILERLQKDLRNQISNSHPKWHILLKLHHTLDVKIKLKIFASTRMTRLLFAR